MTNTNVKLNLKDEKITNHSNNANLVNSLVKFVLFLVKILFRMLGSWGEKEVKIKNPENLRPSASYNWCGVGQFVFIRGNPWLIREGVKL